MVRFLRNLFVICLPAFLFMALLEYKLADMNTHYRTKSIAMEKQLADIEILSLGSSNAYFDIDPTAFSHRGYNLAFNAQSPYYDYMLLAKYIERMPKLKVVILPAIYYTMGTNLTKGSQEWRMYFYQQYFDIPPESEAANPYMPYRYYLEPRNFSKIALYGSNIHRYWREHFRTQVDYVPEEDGWYKSADVAPAKLENKNGEISAVAQNKSVDTAAFVYNFGYWQRLADLAKEYHVKLVVVRLPAHPTFYNNLDPQKTAMFQKMAHDFAAKNDAVYVDYTKDPRFTVVDYTVMIDHMNPHGAPRFSEIFDREVLQPLF